MKPRRGYRGPKPIGGALGWLLDRAYRWDFDPPWPEWQPA